MACAAGYGQCRDQRAPQLHSFNFACGRLTPPPTASTHCLTNRLTTHRLHPPPPLLTSPQERSAIESDFAAGRVRVVVATVAFGMGAHQG